jgi:hypothetical protein
VRAFLQTDRLDLKERGGKSLPKKEKPLPVSVASRIIAEPVCRCINNSFIRGGPAQVLTASASCATSAGVGASDLWRSRPESFNLSTS